MEVVEVITAGPQGPPGPEGPEGPAGGERLEFTVVVGDDPVQAYRLVVPRLAEQNVRHARNDQLTDADRPLWLTLHAALPDEEVRVVSGGIVTNPGWAWAQGPIFLAADGLLTQTPPEYPDAVFSVQVGYSVDSDSMYVERFPPTVLG